MIFNLTFTTVRKLCHVMLYYVDNLLGCKKWWWWWWWNWAY